MRPSDAGLAVLSFPVPVLSFADGAPRLRPPQGVGHVHQDLQRGWRALQVLRCCRVAPKVLPVCSSVPQGRGAACWARRVSDALRVMLRVRCADLWHSPAPWVWLCSLWGAEGLPSSLTILTGQGIAGRGINSLGQEERTLGSSHCHFFSN